MIRSNLFYKLLALAVAMVLWVYVNAERNPQARRTLTVPIEITNLTRGYAAEPKTTEVNVTVSGLKTVVDPIRKEDVKAWVDLASVRPGAPKRVKVIARVAGVGENDIEIAVNPKAVEVQVEALGAKRLAVELKLVAAPPLGYSFGSPLISPSTVRVSGKSTQVERVKRIVLTLPESASSGLVDDYFPVAALDSSGTVVDGVKLDTDRVQLKMELVEVPATKAVLVSPNISGEPKYPAKVTRVSVSPSSVTLQGKPSALIGVSTVTTDRIPVDDATATIVRDVALRLPPGVDAAGRDTVRVTIYISANP